MNEVSHHIGGTQHHLGFTATERDFRKAFGLHLGYAIFPGIQVRI
jgi:hypothetical protein